MYKHTELSETEEILEKLHRAGFIDKRVSQGITQWRINEKGRKATQAEIADAIVNREKNTEKGDVGK